jgi:hypothetical protein
MQFKDWVLLLLGFVLGYIANLLATGGRRMLARFILQHKIHVGAIILLVQGSDAYWVAPVDTQANPFWKLLVDEMEAVTATITFNSNEGRQTCESGWVSMNTPDLPSVGLHVGSKNQRVGLTEKHYNTRLFINGRPKGDDGLPIILDKDYDIEIQLRSDDKLLGQWKFNKAIVQGEMQLVTPTKVC